MKISKSKFDIAMARAQLDRVTLAEKSNMPIPTLNAVIKRECCKPATAGRIAEALGVDVTDIIE